MADLKVVSVEELKQKTEQIITLVDWDEANNLQEINVKVKKVSLTTLIQTGVVPNSLLSQALNLKNPNRKKEKKAEDFSPEMIEASLEAMKKITEAVLVEPPFEEVKDFLSDNHFSQITAYVTGGVRSLESFRHEQESLRRSFDSE